MRISNKTPLCLLPAVCKDRAGGKPSVILPIHWEDQYGTMPPDVELFLMWIENKDLLRGTCLLVASHVPTGYDQLQLNDTLLMKTRIDSMAAKRTRPVGMTEVQPVLGDDIEQIECEGSIDEALEEETPPLVVVDANNDHDSEISDNVISGEEDASDEDEVVVPVEVSNHTPSQKHSHGTKQPPVHEKITPAAPIPVPERRPPRPPTTIPTRSVVPPARSKSTAPRPPIVDNHPKRTASDVDDASVHDANNDEYEEGEAAADDIMERQTLLRQLDLLRMKFKQSIIPPRQHCAWVEETVPNADHRHRDPTNTHCAADCRTQPGAIETRTECARATAWWVLQPADARGRPCTN